MRDSLADHTAGTKLALILGAPPRQVNERWAIPCGPRSSILSIFAFQEHTRIVPRATPSAHFLGWDPCNSSHGLQARTRRISPALIGFAFLKEEHFMHRAIIAFGLSLAMRTLAFCHTSHRTAVLPGH